MNPLQALVASASYTLPALLWGAVLFGAERLAPARPLPRTRGWWARVAALQAGMMAVGWLGSVTWMAVLPGARSWTPDLGPAWVAGGVAYLVSTVVFYGWHRLRHESPFCWRWFHQVHHSPERVEAVTAFYSHPFEVLASSVVLALCVFVLLGLDLAAYNWCTLYSSCVGLFYHSNLRVPHAWSYVLQTPDLHRVHHQTGRHRGNYADLPVIDLLFGTFVHPATFSGQTGFAEERETRFGALLAGRDVHEGSRPG